MIGYRSTTGFIVSVPKVIHAIDQRPGGGDAGYRHDAVNLLHDATGDIVENRRVAVNRGSVSGKRDRVTVRLHEHVADESQTVAARLVRGIDSRARYLIKYIVCRGLRRDAADVEIMLSGIRERQKRATSRRATFWL